jgi:hypothetical protein
MCASWCSSECNEYCTLLYGMSCCSTYGTRELHAMPNADYSAVVPNVLKVCAEGTLNVQHTLTTAVKAAHAC